MFVRGVRPWAALFTSGAQNSGDELLADLVPLPLAYTSVSSLVSTWRSDQKQQHLPSSPFEALISKYCSILRCRGFTVGDDSIQS